jgi:hypothetical protein
MRGVTAKYYEDMKTMNDIVDKSACCSLSPQTSHPPLREVIADRRANPREDRDLLDLMLNGGDPQTHQHLSEENIRYQVRSLCTVAAPWFTQIRPARHFPYCWSRNSEILVF